MPRKITIFLSAPPGDGLRSAREYFQEYVKPVLVAAALDWDVVEGRREGEVRAGLAEKVRKLRRKKGEKPETESQHAEEDAEDAIDRVRQSVGVRDWNGANGDLVIGRHTWKEYIRGLHEGWLGPLNPPPEAPSPSSDNTPLDPIPTTDAQDSSQRDTTALPTETVEAPKPTPDKPKKPSGPIPPYINPSQYPTLSIAPTAPSILPPSTLLPFPHLLGFFNTPIRIYRFLTRRQLADRVGHDVAALVLGTYTRPYGATSEFSSSIDPDSPSGGPMALGSAGLEGGSIVESGKRWEQQGLLEDEEQEWHKSARKPNPAGEEGKERVWLEDMVMDERIGARMRAFELGPEEEAKAVRITNGVESDVDGEREGGDRSQGIGQRMKTLVGWGGDQDGKGKGWEQGLVGDEGE